MNRKNRNSIASCLKLPQFITMNVIDGQAGLVRYYSLIFYSLTINNILNIIILLILAGISIQSITNTGLFANAKRAKDESMKGQLKEEISLAIQSIQTEEIYKGNGVTLETLVGGQLENALTDITVELDGDEINGEYKNYEYTIDSNLKVTINGEVSGAKISGTAEVQTAGYVFEGTTVDVKVTANVTEGTITGIEAPETATIKTDTSATEKVYTVSKSGTYVFKVTTDSGKTKNIKATVNNILSAPQIKIDNVTWNSFRINVENDYPEGAITEYKYYVGGAVKQQGTTNKSYKVTGLAELTEYNNIQVTAYINSANKVSNVEKATTDLKDGIAYSWDEIAEMAKAISNDSSITDDSDTATVNGKTLKVGQMKNLDGKRVRILGFNHDTLSEPSTAYGSTTATGKAGISFEYVEVKNYEEPEIHKGVKDVTNQDSGYNADEVHTWVIESDIPSNLDNYKLYDIVDNIDYRLKFEGTNKVVVKIGNTTLKEGTDYKISFVENTNGVQNKTTSGKLTLTFLDTENGMNASTTLKNNQGKKIQVIFNTTFAKDENGNLLATMGEQIPNQAKLEYINKRYEKHSTIITTNKPFGKWHEIFGDVTLANAILDRLLHHSHIININGNSYRLKDKIKSEIPEEN